MADKRLLYAAWGASAAACIAAGLGLGWLLWGKPSPLEGGPAPERRQADGSLVIERAPAERLPAPPHALPEGAREERRVKVVLTPEPAECPPVRLTLSVARLPDGSARVVASSPDGRVTGGVDVPVTTVIAAAAPRHWAAGVSYAGDQAWGVFVHRDIWRLRAGLEVNATADGGAEARATIGVTW
jgi:hypothetical protein